MRGGAHDASVVLIGVIIDSSLLDLVPMFEVSMRAHSAFSSTTARCLLFSIATTFLGLTWGCGGMEPQATLSESDQAKVQEAQDAMKKARKAREKHTAPDAKGKAQ